MQLAVIASLALFASAAGVASAQTTRPTLSADLGFDGVFRPDTWTPVFVHVADAVARPATIEIRTTRGRVGHVIDARVVTSVAPSTFTLYAPIGTFDRVRVQLRASDDGTLLRELDLTDAATATPAALGGPVFGVGGSPAVTTRVVNGLIHDTGEQVAAGAVPLKLLPDRPVGYASIDVLVLPELDTDALDDSAQAAIVRWTRAGGIVIAWPGPQAATKASPLRTLLPATIGDVVQREIARRPVTVRTLTPLANDAGVAELSDGDGTIFSRRVGLGQIVLCAIDPSLPSPASADERVAMWRRITSNQLRLLASERRNGLFDPLVAEARGEQSLAGTTNADRLRPALAVGLLLALLMGPGELVLLAVAGRHPRAGFTLVGVAGTIICGLGLILYAPARGRDLRIDLIVETDAGEATRIALSSTAEPHPQAAWLSGERLDPTRQSAGELSLGQRDDGFAVNRSIALSDIAPRIRSIVTTAENPPAPRIVVNDVAAHNASDEAWSALALVSPGTVAIAGAVAAGADASSPASPATAATAVKTNGRVQTGIEQLAAMPGWEPVLMDRGLASRLVALQEREQATIGVARIDRSEGPKFVVHVTRVPKAS